MPKSVTTAHGLDSRRLAEGLLRVAPKNPAGLHAWLRTVCNLNIPRRSMCPGHVSPFAYLCESFFGQSDLLVWANRGGGKTTLAAVACLLDALFKRPVKSAVLAGSFDQSDRLVNCLRQLLTPHEALLHPRWLRDRLWLDGSSVLSLAQSQQAVRGLRVQKLRCDEVDLFDRDVWRAAQFVTQSSGQTRGSLEVFSTLHRPGGLMDDLVTDAMVPPGRAGQDEGPGALAGFRLMRWCLWEVIERCPCERKCRGCPLHADCAGRARKAEGFFRIDDAIAIKSRASRAAWESEMLCQRPRGEGLVFDEFRRELHVLPAPYRADWPVYRAIDFGYSNPLVCLWVQVSPGGLVQVIDEYTQQRRAIDAHGQEMLARERRHGYRPALATYVDPAGHAHEVASGQACTELLSAAGIPCTSCRSALGDGLELIRQHLAPAQGPPRLIIDPHCEGLIRSFETYRYTPNTGRPAKDGPDHAIDALRYFFVNRMAPQLEVKRKRY